MADVPMIDRIVAARTLHSGKIGDRINIALGGKTDARFGGGPLTVDAELRSISDGRYIGEGPTIGGLYGAFGPSAVLRIGGIDILVVTIAEQMLDLQQFNAFGIDRRKSR
jgi:microcystin degradation protein MlrC